MKKQFLVLSERHEGFAFPVGWQGIYPFTYNTEQEAEKFGLTGCPSEWIEEVEILPNGAIKRPNGELFTYDRIGRSFIKPNVHNSLYEFVK
jgi:hypothetical protein